MSSSGQGDAVKGTAELKKRKKESPYPLVSVKGGEEKGRLDLKGKTKKQKPYEGRKKIPTSPRTMT